MNGKVSNNKDEQPLHEYSRAQELVNNLPYIAMTVLGAAIFIVGFENPVWRWITASAYMTYGVAGAFWIMIFLCPYCPRWNTTCPCGYGRIAAKLRKKKGNDRFKEKFKKHIPVIVPLWFIPILFGAAVIVRSFSWPLLILLAVFALDAFVVLVIGNRLIKYSRLTI
jgi:membrane protein YdbS with pleckstrin-like domain